MEPVSIDWPLRALLIAHAVAGIVTTGAAVHHGILCWRNWKGAVIPKRLRRLYPKIMLWGYGVSLGLGLLVYPSFVENVRLAGMDTSLPWATGLFEIKEHWSALAFGTLLFHHVPVALDLADQKRSGRLFNGTGIALAVMTTYAAIVGEFLVMVDAP
jgi:hypothetical protein